MIVGKGVGYFDCYEDFCVFMVVERRKKIFLRLE